MIAIIDYGSGNVMSVANALDKLGESYVITSNSEQLASADSIILPGVGSFGDVVAALKQRNLFEQLKSLLNSGKKFLGICVGLQVLFDSSEESPGVAGLSLFEGSNVKYTQGKVPQIGWNKITWTDSKVEDGYVYFVNSYYALPTNKKIIFATSEYGNEFAAAIKSDNITAFQFHPEKSGEYGLSLLKRWIEC